MRNSIISFLAVILCLLMIVNAQKTKIVSFDNLRCAAWNIQVFGTTKMSDPRKVNSIVKVLSGYDLVVIQEVRDATQTAIYQLVDKLNQNITNVADKYSLTVSERLGPTSSKEQYAYVHRNSKVRVERAIQYPVSAGHFDRPPFILFFSLVNDPRKNVFAHSVVHTSPSKAVAEIDSLVNVYEYVNTNETLGLTSALKLAARQNFVFMGDFNGACTYVKPTDWHKIRLRNESRFTWLIPDTADTTATPTDCAYDRFVLSRYHTSLPGLQTCNWCPFNKTGSDFTPEVAASVFGGHDYSCACNATVFEYDRVYDLEGLAATEVSDHWPIQYNLIVPLVENEKPVDPPGPGPNPPTGNAWMRKLGALAVFTVFMMLLSAVCFII